MKNLGTANGWALTGTPVEYTKHVAECGTEYETTICYMEYPAEAQNRYCNQTPTPRG